MNSRPGAYTPVENNKVKLSEQSAVLFGGLVFHHKCVAHSAGKFSASLSPGYINVGQDH